MTDEHAVDELIDEVTALREKLQEVRGLAENWYALAEDPTNGLNRDEWGTYQRCAQELKGVLP